MGGDETTLIERASVIFNIVKENNAKYLILTSTDLELESQADAYQEAYKTVLAQHPEIFNPIFQSSDERCVIYRIHDAAK